MVVGVLVALVKILAAHQMEPQEPQTEVAAVVEVAQIIQHQQVVALEVLALSLFVIQDLKKAQAVLLPAAADIPIIHLHHRGHTQHELSWHTPIWQYDPHGHEHHGH
jgi:hypothetical protein